jgi:hypothetical protein
MATMISTPSGINEPRRSALVTTTKLATSFAVLPLLSLGACVTINIYFPAAAAEKAAEKIVDEVWNLQKSTTTPLPGKDNKLDLPPGTVQPPVTKP